MKYFFLPIDRHADFGMGVTADSFKAAAEKLLENSHEKDKVIGQLPICFLFRHSIELYLKSMILVLHTGLEVPFEENRFFPVEGVKQ